MQDRTAYPYLSNICTWQLVEFNTSVVQAPPSIYHSLLLYYSIAFTRFYTKSAFFYQLSLFHKIFFLLKLPHL